MNNRRTRLRAAAAAAALVLAACSVPAPASAPRPATSTISTAPTAPATPVDYPAMESAIETSITSGPVALDNVRAVLVIVDGRTEVAHYRHGFTGADHAHVFSVTKSVVSTLIGIAIADGLIAGLDQPLRELLPEHRRKMTAQVATVTLRDLLTMSGGFAPDMSDATARRIIGGRLDLVDWAVSDGQQTAAGTRFLYSDTSAHLAAAVLLSALQHNPATKGQTVLDYARVKLFDPLGILTRPAYQGLPFGTEFEKAGFGWGQFGNLALGGFGLRLTAEDMAKMGQLYLDDGMWHGTRVLPEGWVQQVTAPGETEKGYGLFWWRDTEWGLPTYAAVGAGGQRIVVVPARRAVIVVLSASNTKYEMDTELVAPLVNDVIIRALQ